MNHNLTLAIEEDVLRRARLVAAHKKKTLTGMVREYLENLVQEDKVRKTSLDRHLKIIKAKPMKVGRASLGRENCMADKVFSDCPPNSQENRLSKPAQAKPSLRALLSKVRPENLHGETQTGRPVGNEVG